MTQYQLSKGVRRNKQIRFIQLFILGMLVAFTVLFGGQQLFKHWDKESAKIMSVQYCWDSDGNHYVAPDERCRN